MSDNPAHVGAAAIAARAWSSTTRHPTAAPTPPRRNVRLLITAMSTWWHGLPSGAGDDIHLLGRACQRTRSRHYERRFFADPHPLYGRRSAKKIPRRVGAVLRALRPGAKRSISRSLRSSVAAVTAPAEVRYARASGDVDIAYTVFGEGPFDLVVAMGFVTHLDT